MRRMLYPLGLILLLISFLGIFPISCSKNNNPTAPSTNTNGVVVTTLAGSAGVTGSANGTGKAALFNFPNKVAVDSSGNVYVADTWNNQIRKISAGGVVTTLAGSGFIGSSNGTGTAASFYYPYGIAVDPSGNVYVADTWNHLIRKITPGGAVTTLAGLAGVAGAVNGMGTAASFYFPGGISVDYHGNVYVADTWNHLIRKIAPDGAVTTLAGTAGMAGAANGMGTAASFYFPGGISVDSHGNVYVADTWNHLIRKIAPGGTVTTLAGTAGMAGATNGMGTAASFYFPGGVAVDSHGNVYVADTNNSLIREINNDEMVTTLAGSGSIGSANGKGTATSFNYPYGLTVDSSGNVYVADTDNQLIRRIQ